MCPMERPRTRYAWNGDSSLAYQIVGDGPVDLVYLQGFLSNVELNWDHPACARFFRELSRFSRLIVTDRRGLGCSERFTPADIPPIETLVDDLLAVLDEAGSERPAILATGDSGFIALPFAATHPDRVSAPILHAWGLPRGGNRRLPVGLDGRGAGGRSQEACLELDGTWCAPEPFPHHRTSRGSPGATSTSACPSRPAAAWRTPGASTGPTFGRPALDPGPDARVVSSRRRGTSPASPMGDPHLASTYPHGEARRARGLRPLPVGVPPRGGDSRDRAVSRLGAGRRGRSRPGARDCPLHGHRRLDGEGGGARRCRLARARPAPPRDGPRPPRALPGPGDRHGRGRILRDLRRACPGRALRRGGRRGREAARDPDPSRRAHRRGRDDRRQGRWHRGRHRRPARGLSRSPRRCWSRRR